MTSETTPPEPGTFLAALGPAEREELLALGVRERRPAGATLFTENGETTSVLVLLEGWVEADTDEPGGAAREGDAGDALVPALHGPGSLLGELSAVVRGPRSATVRALEPVHTLKVPPEEFEAFLARRPGVSIQIARTWLKRAYIAGIHPY
ncbi:MULTISPECIES: cyclic nucleotide-binding domain-containing protein [Actinomadura]|uniref:Cyclic nucleotide-binding domain-containing protein n=1 Tax=Actinomadura yumaensis TaxID=111807 RepID=A0ABW2CRV6_9ACTN|nr:cyclic nucleotide-binding domain-containing protein [Actinomadura sp. J1-007]MWK40454.1 cyclic nucleotide-binding domain-containing protein [Actinomadura sp. J1-007]